MSTLPPEGSVVGTSPFRDSEWCAIGVQVWASRSEYVAHHNKEPKPFIWTKSARDIRQKVIRANSRLSSKQNGNTTPGQEHKTAVIEKMTRARRL
jgi:hypothetical protein